MFLDDPRPLKLIGPRRRPEEETPDQVPVDLVAIDEPLYGRLSDFYDVGVASEHVAMTQTFSCQVICLDSLARETKESSPKHGKVVFSAIGLSWLIELSQ